ncbi:MAG: hypothetical protein ACP5M4_06900 [Acidobacteriaceae bacterium]
MNREEQDLRARAIEEMERELAEPLRHFRGAVTAMAERELERMPRVALRSGKQWGWRAAWLYAWAPAAALLVLMAVGLAMGHHHAAATPMNEGPAMAQNEQPPTPRAQEHVSDTALLTEIDEDLNQNAPTPLAPLEVSTSKTHATATQAEDTNGVEP